MTCPNDATPTVVKVKRMLPAPPDRVFAAWTDPNSLMQWFVPGTAKATAVEIDARPGGRFRIAARNNEEGDFEITGVYREVSPPTRLVFTWISRHTRDAESLVTVELRAEGAQTELTITHEALRDADTVGRHQRGWETIAAALGDVLSKTGG
jgi:uncharacterized protein YndB with AHSA1/START domain